MQVIMLTTVATVHGSYKEKQMYDLTEQRAKKLIARGLAEPVAQRERTSRRKTTSLSHGDKS